MRLFFSSINKKLCIYEIVRNAIESEFGASTMGGGHFVKKNKVACLSHIGKVAIECMQMPILYDSQEKIPICFTKNPLFELLPYLYPHLF